MPLYKQKKQNKKKHTHCSTGEEGGPSTHGVELTLQMSKGSQSLLMYVVRVKKYIYTVHSTVL